MASATTTVSANQEPGVSFSEFAEATTLPKQDLINSLGLDILDSPSPFSDLDHIPSVVFNSQEKEVEGDFSLTEEELNEYYPDVQAQLDAINSTFKKFIINVGGEN